MVKVHSSLTQIDLSTFSKRKKSETFFRLYFSNHSKLFCSEFFSERSYHQIQIQSKVTSQLPVPHCGLISPPSAINIQQIFSNLDFQFEFKFRSFFYSNSIVAHKLHFFQMSMWPACICPTLMPTWQSCLTSRLSIWAWTRTALSNQTTTGRVFHNSPLYTIY